VKATDKAYSSPRAGVITFALILFAFTLFSAPALKAQSLSSYERQRGLTILQMVKTDLEENYYDPTFRGRDMKALFKEAEELIKKAVSNGQVYSIIASVLVELNDSHTTFIPPSRVARTEYGWQMKWIGDNAYVVAVKPGSDAEAKGLKPGDIIHSVNGLKPTRETLWQIKYLFYSLRPQTSLDVVVQKPDGKQSQLEVAAKIIEGKRVTDLTNYTEFMKYLLEAEKVERLERNRYIDIDGDTIIWKMAGFNLYDKDEVDSIMGKVKKFKALILDLRGNGGGYVVMLERLLSHLFDHDVKIADLKGRKEMKPSIAKTRGKEIFTGKIVVLIDSESGSAAEVFARVMQLEKRGIVIGDRSSGKVMQSRVYPRQVGVDTVAFFGTNITNADLIMTDGKSLEHVGVNPDELVIPTAADLASGRDPILTRAAELIGFKLDPVKAGEMFPVEWRK
jgi:C-terminal peptidase prc